MSESSHMADLGFAEVHVPYGAHVCQIYNNRDERNDSLLKFLSKGLEQEEAVGCFSDNEFYEFFKEHYPRKDISFDDSLHAGGLVFADAAEFYFRNNRFDPDYMLQALGEFYDNCQEKDYPGGRIIGEMLPEILEKAGGERLLEYESRVSLFLRENPITTVCQYDANAFSGAMIMDVLRVHPMLVVRGTVVHNPFYQTPEDFLDI